MTNIATMTKPALPKLKFHMMGERRTLASAAALLSWVNTSTIA